MRHVEGTTVGALTVYRFRNSVYYVRYAIEAVDGTQIASSYVSIHDMLTLPARSSLGVDTMAFTLHVGAYVANARRDEVINGMCDALRRWIGP